MSLGMNGKIRHVDCYPYVYQRGVFGFQTTDVSNVNSLKSLKERIDSFREQLNLTNVFEIKTDNSQFWRIVDILIWLNEKQNIKEMNHIFFEALDVAKKRNMKFIKKSKKVFDFFIKNCLDVKTFDIFESTFNFNDEINKLYKNNIFFKEIKTKYEIRNFLIESTLLIEINKINIDIIENIFQNYENISKKDEKLIFKKNNSEYKYIFNNKIINIFKEVKKNNESKIRKEMIKFKDSFFIDKFI